MRKVNLTWVKLTHRSNIFTLVAASVISMSEFHVKRSPLRSLVSCLRFREPWVEIDVIMKAPNLADATRLLIGHVFVDIIGNIASKNCYCIYFLLN